MVVHISGACIAWVLGVLKYLHLPLYVLFITQDMWWLVILRCCSEDWSLSGKT